MIDEIERHVEALYDRYSFPPVIRTYLEKFLQDGIQKERAKYETELDGLRRERDRLERKRKKLLEAHYDDAIPLDLLKEEQQKISKQLAAIEHQEKAHEATFEEISERLTDALELVEDCGNAYRLAEDPLKRMMNQVIFSKLWIEEDGHVTAEFARPFNAIIEPLTDMIIKCNQEKIRGTEVRTDFWSIISNHVQKFFGRGLNNELMVDLKGIEPSNLTDANRALSQLSYRPISYLEYPSV